MTSGAIDGAVVVVGSVAIGTVQFDAANRLARALHARNTRITHVRLSSRLILQNRCPLMQEGAANWPGKSAVFLTFYWNT
jgi:hypothetical protein